MHHIYRFFVFVVVMSVFPSLHAEIYKWQDENGKWHFSDNPRDAKGQSTKKVQSITKRRAAAVDKDLDAQLTDRFQPQTPIERVTLGVVGIETALGQGSGFFISNDGYIVTNKHVVRPSNYDGRIIDQFEEQERRLKKIKRNLDDERDYLEDYGQKLGDYRRDVYGITEADGSIAVEEYKGYQERYDKRMKEYKSQLAIYEKRYRKFKKSKSDYTLKSSLAGAATRFDIYLKNNVKLKASLIEVSADYDLALLKLNGYVTPGLTMGNEYAVRQGQSVFAVGSPMGMRDSVTSGVITRRQVEYLVTDARILPGNSGGPLLDEEGQVLGVNTLKKAEEVMADGFGLAIPVSVVKSEFSEHLR